LQAAVLQEKDINADALSHRAVGYDDKKSLSANFAPTGLLNLLYAHISHVCTPRLAVAGPPDSRAAKGKPSRLGDVAYGLATECRP
jgi:hypothetical protein